MYIWVPDASKVVVPNKSEEFFQEFSDYITVRQFDYDDAIQGTPFKGDPFFGNGTLVKSSMPAAGSYSDIVRILILNKYGGKCITGGRREGGPQAQFGRMYWDSMAADNVRRHASITAGCCCICCIHSFIGSCRGECRVLPCYCLTANNTHLLVVKKYAAAEVQASAGLLMLGCTLLLFLCAPLLLLPLLLLLLLLLV
jgi:hypothetical protein